jgi:hypothetical protein
MVIKHAELTNNCKAPTVKKNTVPPRQTSKAGNNRNRKLYHLYMNGFNGLKMSISGNIFKFNEWRKLNSGIGCISICHPVTPLMTNLIIIFRAMTKAFPECAGPSL